LWDKVHRYFTGDSELRERKLEVIVQIGIDQNVMSWTLRCVLWLMSLLLHLLLEGPSSVMQCATSDSSTSIPAINLTVLGDCHHFGGCKSKSLSNPNNTTTYPSNYVSSTLFMNSQRKNTFVAKLVLGITSARYMNKNITDISYNLAGEYQSHATKHLMNHILLLKN
jgi:hypothetical protein